MCDRTLMLILLFDITIINATAFTKLLLLLLLREIREWEKMKNNGSIPKLVVLDRIRMFQMKREREREEWYGREGVYWRLWSIPEHRGLIH